MYRDMKTLKALLVSSIVIIVVIVSFNLYIKLSQVSEKVLHLAQMELKFLLENLSDRRDMDKNNFIYIKFIDKNDKTIYFKKQERLKKLIQDFKIYDHHLVTINTGDIYEKIIHNQQENKFYFEFKHPYIFKNINGYIEGIYLFPDKELEKIYKNIFYSIIEVVTSILVAFLLLYPVIIYLNKAYILQSQKLLEANLEIMSVLGGAVAKRDSETNTHNYRVTLYAVEFAHNLNIEDKQIMSLIKGAFLHDVGKIGISDNILLKAGKLSTQEFEIMKKHVEYGVEIISNSSWLDDAHDVVAYHHERYDGKGYTQGLKAENIPLNARIFMICDVFDALTSKRPYKEGYSLDISIEMIKERAGTHFDAELVDVFCEFIPHLYNKISLIESDEQLHTLLHEKIKYLYKLDES